MFLRVLVFFGLFVTELAEVHDSAHGRRRRGGNFHQIHALLPRQRERLVEREDAEVFFVRVNDPHFAGADFAVDPDVRGGREIT